MKTIKVIINREWKFLADVCVNPQVDLVDGADDVDDGEPFIEFDGDKYRAYMMTRERIGVPIGRHKTLNRAIFHALR
jgi:hypothetical protein